MTRRIIGSNPASIMARAAIASPDNSDIPSLSIEGGSGLVLLSNNFFFPGLVKFFKAHKHQRAVSGNGQPSSSVNNNGGEMLSLSSLL
jgi:hypothetical protein